MEIVDFKRLLSRLQHLKGAPSFNMNYFLLFLRRKLYCALSLYVALLPAELLAGEQADLAIKKAQELIASGNIANGTVIKLVAKQGNLANFLGNNNRLKLEWEAKTGVLIDAATMPQKASFDFIQDTEGVDLTIARNREYADLRSNGLIEDLTAYLAHYDFNMLAVAEDAYYLPKLQAYFNNLPVAIPADGDMAILYLRKDLLEDQRHKERYYSLYGEALKRPVTWKEYLQQVRFFHDPKSGFYGSLEQRDEASGWMFWMPRYASKAYPNQYLFDDNMRPLLDSDAGIEATQSYIDTVKYSPQGILNKESNYTYTLPLFLNGKGYSTIITLAGAKIFNLKHSKINDKYTAVPMPGHMVKQEVVRRTTLIYGNNFVIPSTSKNKEIAFLLAMWLTDPDISIQGLKVKKGFADPYRFNHFNAPEIINTYGKQVLEVALASLEHTVPAGTGLPGDSEYIDALNKQLYLASLGEKSAKLAMQDTVSVWEEITEKYGRENQVEYWREVKRLYPHFEKK